ncbi:hypothetical protein L195_g007844 [Trifolium pratense]|uniref:Uncharacterized protein n=1 Tax=Trifolium pratense TaxID=57577 RepID=A0A2K3P7I9_TRIPR|nr:hypothetical protein L195_g007844 [Trifolium pratense]
MLEFQTQNLVTIDAAVDSQPPREEEQEQHLKMDDTSLYCDQIPDADDVLIELDCQNDPSEGRKEFLAPAIGMEFESYDDAYNYYVCYAKEFQKRYKNWLSCDDKDGVSGVSEMEDTRGYPRT